MRALPLFVLALLAAPAVATPPVDEDVAWLASQAGVAPGDLPATVPLRVTSLTPAGPVVEEQALPLAELARRMRAAASDGVPPPTVPSFAGAGLRATTGQGVGWNGYALGSRDMACISLSVEQQLVLPPNPALGNPASVLVRAALPTEGVSSRAGLASMDVRALPTPSAARSSVPAVVAESDLLFGGVLSQTCYLSFTLRISFASYLGDGTIRGA